MQVVGRATPEQDQALGDAKYFAEQAAGSVKFKHSDVAL